MIMNSTCQISVQQDINISVYSLLQKEKLPQVVSLYLNIFVCIQINMAVIKKDLLFLNARSFHVKILT